MASDRKALSEQTKSMEEEIFPIISGIPKGDDATREENRKAGRLMELLHHSQILSIKAKDLRYFLNDTAWTFLINGCFIILLLSAFFVIPNAATNITKYRLMLFGGIYVTGFSLTMIFRYLLLSLETMKYFTKDYLRFKFINVNEKERNGTGSV
jgi:hypothetical protein